MAVGCGPRPVRVDAPRGAGGPDPPGGGTVPGLFSITVQVVHLRLMNDSIARELHSGSNATQNPDTLIYSIGQFPAGCRCEPPGGGGGQMRGQGGALRRCPAAPLPGELPAELRCQRAGGGARPRAELGGDLPGSGVPSRTRCHPRIRRFL